MNEPSRFTIGTTTVSVANPWLFFGVTFLITWSFWLSAIVLEVSFSSAAGLVLLLTGLVGPGIAGIGFVYLVYDDRGRSDFWSRITQVRRIGSRWFLVLLLLPLAVTTVAAVVDLLLGGPGATWGEGVQEFGGNPLAILPALFFASLPPILEELGWRGYALDRLQLNWSALNASVILGAVWAVWHLPLFFIEGTFQREMVGFGTLGFWLFMVGTVALSVAFTWVYNHTSRSILGIILMHGWVNFVSETIEVADVIYYSHWVLLAVLLTAIWGAKTLTNAEEVPRPPLPLDR
ncbi:CPBP family intramembrane glutamic endopeptidase [Natrinema halophilum]|uniref:CPBP family intramembrane metalloprotease n=1 Tax=Natrinema halophilum TaxID=1699371 RepID=A0A7D5GN38_9EURY|nr:type II CAAX endopeptidase family protein [Natrinema halophilum]QLG50612.1 CPBP family intramembrane metalloprotease [Natrinema halophilum]